MTFSTSQCQDGVKVLKPVMNEDVRALKIFLRKAKNTEQRIENSNRYFFKKVRKL